MMPRRRATASVASSLASSTSSTVSTTSRGISRKHSSSVFAARYAGITTTIFCPCSMGSSEQMPLTLTLSPQAGRGKKLPLPPGRERTGVRVGQTLPPIRFQAGSLDDTRAVTAGAVEALAAHRIPVFNLARPRSNSDNALQQLRIPDLFPPAIARGLLSAWAQGDMVSRLAGRGVTVLVRLVEINQVFVA